MSDGVVDVGMDGAHHSIEEVVLPVSAIVFLV
jgi:hypothetical protein